MKIAIVTITARSTPRLDVAAKTLAFTVGKAKTSHPDVVFDWIIVDEKGRGLNQLMSPDDAASVVLAMHQISVVQPPQTLHRLPPDPRPAHNTARNAGLGIANAAQADYVVILNDCNVVTPDWASVAADVAKLQLGWKCKTKSVFDRAVPPDGRMRAGDHHDRFHDVPALSASGACWGAPMAKFNEVGGFDTAYDGQSYNHDLECVLRLSRVGVKFVTTERAFTVMMRRTKLDHEISTNMESNAGKANRTRFVALRRDPQRILPTQFAAGQSLATSPAIVGSPGAHYTGEFGDAFTATGELSAAGSAFARSPDASSPSIAQAAPAQAPEEEDPSMIKVTFVGRLDKPRCLNLLKRSIKDFSALYEIVKIETKGKPSNVKTTVSYRALYPDGTDAVEPAEPADDELPAADEVDIDVRLGEGTCVWARKFASPVPKAREVAIFGRPCEGEAVSGTSP